MFAHMALCWPHLKINLHDDGDGSGGKPTIVAAVSCHAPRSLTAPKKATETITTTTTKAVSGRLQGYTCSSPDLLFSPFTPTKAFTQLLPNLRAKAFSRVLCALSGSRSWVFSGGGAGPKI